MGKRKKRKKFDDGIREYEDVPPSTKNNNSIIGGGIDDVPCNTKSPPGERDDDGKKKKMKMNKKRKLDSGDPCRDGGSFENEGGDDDATTTTKPTAAGDGGDVPDDEKKIPSTPSERKRRKKKKRERGKRGRRKSVRDGSDKDEGGDETSANAGRGSPQLDASPRVPSAARDESDAAGASASPDGGPDDDGVVVVDFPFDTDPDDHCETPAEAYRHVAPILERIASQLDGGGGGGAVGRTAGTEASRRRRRPPPRRDALRIYDPYYCDGAAKRNLADLGFTDVYNEKEDCYEAWSTIDEGNRSAGRGAGRYPRFDVLVTNPPYSGDHIEKLIRHVTSVSYDGSSSSSGKPWLLLLPNWVHKKPFYVEATSSIRPFYLIPRKRYVYRPPRNFRDARKSDVHKKSSPFVSMWYVWGGTHSKNEELIRHYHRHHQDHGNNNNKDADERDDSSRCDLARTKSALRDLRRRGR